MPVSSFDKAHLRTATGAPRIDVFFLYPQYLAEGEAWLNRVIIIADNGAWLSKAVLNEAAAFTAHGLIAIVIFKLGVCY
jgi:hypothetical protein